MSEKELGAYIKIEVYCKQKIEDILSMKDIPKKSKKEMLAQAMAYQDVLNYIQRVKE